MGKQQSKRRRRLSKEFRAAVKGGDWRRAAVITPAVGKCPTPIKRRFSSRESAEANAKGKAAYRCPCGDWHLTSKGAHP